MSDDNNDLIPDALVPYIPIATAALRTLLATLGGFGFAWAQAVTASQVQMAVSAAAIVTGLGWSIFQKLQAQKQLAKAAAAPKGTPTPVLPA